MTSVKRDLYIEQGASFVLAFQWAENTGTEEEPVAGSAYDLTGYTGRMQIRQKQHEPVRVDATTENSKIVLGEDPTTGIVDLTTGWVTVKLSSEDTDLLDKKKMLYDLELIAASGFVYRMLQGTVIVDPNITQVDLDDPVVED